jgi:hypothetical protein
VVAVVVDEVQEVQELALLVEATDPLQQMHLTQLMDRAAAVVVLEEMVLLETVEKGGME